MLWVLPLCVVALACEKERPPAAWVPPYAPPAAAPAPDDGLLRLPAAGSGQVPAWLDLGERAESEGSGLGLKPELGAWSERAYLAPTRFGVLMLDLERGMRGVAKSPGGNIVQAMLVGDGSVVLVANEQGELYRAADLDAAVSGLYTKVNQLGGATLWDARGKRVVAAGESGGSDKLWISQDEGQTFREGPALPPEVRKLVVRKDGVIAVEIHDFKIWVTDGWRPFSEAKLKAPEISPEGRSWLTKSGVLRRRGDAIIYAWGCPQKALGKSLWAWLDYERTSPSLVSGWPSVVVEPELPKLPTVPLAPGAGGDCLDGVLGALGGRSARTGAGALARAEPAPPRGLARAYGLGDAACKPEDSEERTTTYTVMGTPGAAPVGAKASRTETNKYRACKANAQLLRWGSIGLVGKAASLTTVPVPAGCYLESVSSSIGLQLVACRRVDAAGKASVALGTVLPDGVRLETQLPGAEVERLVGYSYAADGTLVASVDIDGKTRYLLRGNAAPGAGRWSSLPVEAISAKALSANRALLALPGPSPTAIQLALHTPEGLMPLPLVEAAQNVVYWVVTGDNRLKLWLHPRLTHMRQAPSPGEAGPAPFWVAKTGALVPADG